MLIFLLTADYCLAEKARRFFLQFCYFYQLFETADTCLQKLPAIILVLLVCHIKIYKQRSKAELRKAATQKKSLTTGNIGNENEHGEASTSEKFLKYENNFRYFLRNMIQNSCRLS